MLKLRRTTYNKHNTNLAQNSLHVDRDAGNEQTAEYAWHPPFISGHWQKELALSPQIPANACSPLSANDNALQWLYARVYPRDDKVGECPHAY